MLRVAPVLAVPLALLASCHRNLPDRPAAAAPPPPPLVQDEPLIAVKETTTERIKLTLDSTRSQSHIATSLDPDGLGARHSECTCPLSGEVVLRLTTRPDGTRAFAIENLELTTTTSAQFVYNWTPLIGKVTTTVPGGVLRITDREMPRPIPLDRLGRFQKDGAHFSVQCQADIVGRGLLLSRLEEQEADLDITKTTAVTLTGHLVQRDDQWILHVPAAVMRDGFDLDGNILDLAFTAAITAVAE